MMTPDKSATNHRDDSQESPSTPEDVAGLYSWAKLEGSKYRDFSASRDKNRANIRDRKELDRSRQADEAAAASLADRAADAAGPAASPQPVPPPLRLPTTHAARPPAANPQSRVISLTAKKTSAASGRGGTGRWAALHNVFGQGIPTPPSAVAIGVPALAVVSLAGGVGKTSLVASLGRSLATQGESVLLVDANVHGLLPLFFGEHELGTRAISTFAQGSDAPVQVMSMVAEGPEGEPVNEHRLAERIADHTRDVDRVLIDVSTGSAAITRQALRLSPVVLLTLTPDMASVVSLPAAHTFFQRLADETGRPFELFYVLNQFDTSLRLHRDVHDLLARQLGDRLLPFAIRRSSAVSEALAEGMTVMDYVPDSPIVEDLSQLSHWIREFDPVRSSGLHSIRRREQSC